MSAGRATAPRARWVAPVSVVCGLVVLGGGLLMLGSFADSHRSRSGPVGAEHPDASSPDSAPVRAETAAERGYRWLTTKPYIPPTLDRATFDQLYVEWAPAERAEAEHASPDERRRLLFAHYGFTPLPSDPSKPLQYVEDSAGRWSISCLACHGGALDGRPIPGLPNANFAFQSLADDIVATRARTGTKPPAGGMLPFRIPLGETVGTTNAVVFSVALLTFRDKDLNLVFPKKPPHFVHHDLDAPPWWNVRKRARLYIDGFAAKSHRALMQFLMIPTNGPDRVKGWEPDFGDVLAYIESLEAPRWRDVLPRAPIDDGLATRGRPIFERVCASCHGTYGEKPTYPGVDVPIEEIATDRVRHEATTADERARYGASWFTNYEPSRVHVAPKGYVAPPLDGVFASAPYFHNGAVPTLWHVLHPDARPVAWRRTPGAPYDVLKAGFAVETRDAVPAGLDGDARRRWFDTRLPGKSADGHRFPDALSEDEKRAVLEYLKTL